jgi:membrane-bound lytic murein transglycosylase B
LNHPYLPRAASLAFVATSLTALATAQPQPVAPQAATTAPTIVATASAAEPAPFDLSRPDITLFATEVAGRTGLAREQVLDVLALGVRQPKILEAISRPAEKVSPWWQYRARFLTQKRIDEGAQFWAEHRERLATVEQQTGVPAAYVVAIIGVETFYGRIQGSYRVLDALMTLGFDYPPRGAFFRSELEQFLVLAREEQVDPAVALGSYAGAMGAPQFMPSSYRRYAVDGGGDGGRNLFADWDDVIASVANYFKAHGWQAGGPVLAEAEADPALMATLDPRNLQLRDTVASLQARGVRIARDDLPVDAPALLMPAELEDRPNVRVGFGNFGVITRYNRSIRYAMAVHDLAQALTARVEVAPSAGEAARSAQAERPTPAG